MISPKVLLTAVTLTAMENLFIVAQAQHGSGGSTTTTGAAAAAAATTTAATTKTNSGKAAAKQRVVDMTYYFWYITAAISFVYMLSHAYSFVYGWRRSRSTAPVLAAGAAAPMPGFLARSTAATFASFRNVIMLTAAPRWAYEISVNEAGWTVAYTAVCMALGFAGTSGLKSFGNQHGYIAFAQTPLIIGLAGKNNVISALTGIGYEKLNMLHRLSGRVALINSWIHTIAWLRLGLKGKTAISQTYMIWGTVGIVAYTLLTFGSFRPLRNAAYELFLLSHIILVALYLAGMWLHWEKLSYWIYSGIILWCLDRVVRLFMLVILNQLWIMPHSLRSTKGLSDARMEILSEDALRVTVKRPLLKWAAGQHAYIVAPTVSAFPFEAHPFTYLNMPVKTGQGFDDQAGDVQFLLRVRDGFTKRLYNKVADGQTSQKLAILLEGSYGAIHSFTHHDSALFVAGGSGISFAITHFCAVVDAMKEGKARLTDVRLIWIVRTPEALEWIEPILDRYRADILKFSDRLRIDIYATRSNQILSLEGKTSLASSGTVTPDLAHSSSSISSGETPSFDVDKEKEFMKAEMGMGSNMDLNRKKDYSKFIYWHSGRPDMANIVEEVQDKTVGTMCIAVCGPLGLQKDCRAAVKSRTSRSRIMAGKATIQHYEETFGW